MSGGPVTFVKIDGTVLYINPEHVVSVRAILRIASEGPCCRILFVDGSFVNVKAEARTVVQDLTG